MLFSLTLQSSHLSSHPHNSREWERWAGCHPECRAEGHGSCYVQLGPQAVNESHDPLSSVGGFRGGFIAGSSQKRERLVRDRDAVTGVCRYLVCVQYGGGGRTAPPSPHPPSLGSCTVHTLPGPIKPMVPAGQGAILFRIVRLGGLIPHTFKQRQL